MSSVCVCALCTYKRQASHKLSLQPIDRDTLYLGENRSIHAKRRGAVWTHEPQMDEMAAQTLLSLLFRSHLLCSQSGLPLGGRG